ncbi:MAG TPA: tetratricopeptide repeat protein [Gammaproteobacteria bacterium]|nr:tetratricopeptide repeat protein [Gammaproteobacteria bacterium]
MKQLIILLLAMLVSGCGSSGIKPERNISENFMKGERAYANKNYALAKQQFEAVIKAYPDNIAALFKLANISMHERQWDKALSYYTVIIRKRPNYAKAHHNLAMLYLYKAKLHLNYYIANNESFNNKLLGKLIKSIDDYSKNRVERRTPLDKLADAVK